MTTQTYARPDTLVTTEWVATRLNDPSVRIVEVDVDTSAYQQGHIPGAVGWNTKIRDIIPRPQLEQLLGSSGIDNDTTVILYGDNNNWFAAWAFWQLKIYGHQLGYPNVKNYDGSWTEWGNLVGAPVER